jgi:hypothetical protein
VASLTAISADKDEQIKGLRDLVAIKEQTIAALKQLDANSVRMDANSTRDSQLADAGITLLKDQIRDDAVRITGLQGDLDSCRGNQKWVAGLSAFGGGLVGYKLKGNGQQVLQVLNPFTNGGGAFTLTAQPPGFTFARPNYPARLSEAVERAVRQARGEH